MTRTNQMKTTMLAGLLALAGLAAPAGAQQTKSSTTTTSISVSDDEVEGHSTKKIDGVQYSIEFDGDGVHSAYIDGEEVDFKVDGNTIIIKDGRQTIEFDTPSVHDNGRAIFGIGRDDAQRIGERLARVRGGQGNNFFTVSGGPKTMVGLTQRSLDAQLREHLELEGEVGTIIMAVTKGLPADKAGLREGDVLLAVNDRDVTGAGVLTEEMADLEPGDELEVTILRRGLPETVTIEVAAFDAQKLYGNQFFAARAPNAPDAPDAPRILRWDRIDGIDRDDFPFARDMDLDFDFDFEDLEEHIREQLEDAQDLDADQRKALEKALGQAQGQFERAMEQAARARMLGRNRADEFLIRDRDNELPLLIERNARRNLGNREAIVREQAQQQKAELEAEAAMLRARNQELEARLESLESRLDRLIELLEDQSEK